MILALYSKVQAIADQHLTVSFSNILYLPSGVPQKLRIHIIDNTFVDVWLSESGRYSYHWDRRIIEKGIFRFDNAPHKKWIHIKTFPDHFHHTTEANVIESHISQDPEEAINQVLDFVADILIDERK